jgi:capsular exopolysaccharide synthesis family protein
LNPSPDTTAGPGILQSLRRHAILIAVTALLVGGIAALLLSRQSAQYSATSQVVFSTPSEELGIISTGTPPLAPSTRSGATNVSEVQAGNVVAGAARRLGDISASDLRSKMTIAAASTDSDVVDITASGGSEAEAARRADAYAQTVVGMQRQTERKRAQKVASDLQRRLDNLSTRMQRSGEGTNLRDQIFQLQTLARYGSGSPRLIQHGAEDTKRTDNPTQLIVLGILFGLLVGAALALLRERSDRRLRDGEDLVETLDVPVLASVGASKAIRRDTPFERLPEVDAEVFRFLYGKLRFGHGDSPARSVLVTSASDNEGKTSIAVNLASAAAASGARVLLIETDTRRPSLARRFGFESAFGLAEVLRGDVALEDAVGPVPTGSGPHALDVLPAGSAGAEAGALLQSEAARELLERTRATYDLVVLDSSPLGLVADALPLLAHVDGVLIASFVGRSTAADARRLRWQVAEMGGKVLGVVVSNGRPSAGYYAAAGAPASGLSTD